MSLDAYPVRSQVPDEVRSLVGITGNAGATPTVNAGTGQGVTVSWVSTGRYRYTWKDSQGLFLGFLKEFIAATPAALAGFTVVANAFDTTNLAVDLFVYNAAQALADLTSVQQMVAEFIFKRSSATA